MTDSIFGPVISSYSRAQAIADGWLVDVSGTAKEAGIKYPVAMTRTVWDRYVEFDQRTVGQSESGRLWDVLWMFRAAARKSESDTIGFKLHVAIPDGNWESNEELPERGSGLTRVTHRLVNLKAICGPGDDAAPVITIMLPFED